MAKVMLVEDDNNLREIYEARLKAEGYEIISAKDGEEALALAVKERPDLIIADIMMPKVSGFDMVDILRSTPETKKTKIIMMTALSQAEDKARAEKLGADKYLVKSQVTLEDVVRIAHEILDTLPQTAEEKPAAQGGAPAPAVPTPPNPPAAQATPSAPPVTPSTPASAATLTAPPVSDNATSPVSAPGSTVSPSQQVAVTSTSTADEEAQVSQQIEDFIAKNPTLSTSATPAAEPATAPAVAVSTPTPAPVEPPAKSQPTKIPVQTEPEISAPTVPVAPEAPPTITTPQPTPTAADKTMQAAVDSLSGGNGPKATPPTDQSVVDQLTKQPAADNQPEEPFVAQSMSHTKVIQPLSDMTSTTTDLNALLAKEEQGAGATPPPANAVITPDGQTQAREGAPTVSKAIELGEQPVGPGSIVSPPSDTPTVV